MERLHENGKEFYVFLTGVYILFKRSFLAALNGFIKLFISFTAELRHLRFYKVKHFL